MTRREKGIRQVGNKFHVRVYAAPGKKRWVGSFDTLEEAARAKAEASEKRSESCDEFAERWLEDYPPAKESTYVTYHSALSFFKRDFKGTPIDGPLARSPWALDNNVRGNDRQVARAWALRNPHRRSVVRNLYGAALNEGIVTDNPFANLRLPGSKGRREIVPLTEQEVEDLAVCARGLADGVLEGAVLTLAYSGMRVSELFALRHFDVDLATGEARISRRAYNGRVDTPKSGKPRPILLPPRAVEAIASAPRRLGQELIFPSPRGAMFRSYTFARFWSQARSAFEARLSAPRREELDRYRPHNALTPHELRHHAASWMLDQGASIEMVAQQLGHSTTKVTELYGHPDERRMRERLREIVAPRPVTKLESVRGDIREAQADG